jgi:signal transduction histidine kinase/CheY-like chemotaxis protein
MLVSSGAQQAEVGDRLGSLRQVIMALRSGAGGDALPAALGFLCEARDVAWAALYGVDRRAGLLRRRAIGGDPPADVMGPEVLLVAALDSGESPAAVRAVVTRQVVELTVAGATRLAVPVLGTRPDDLRGALVVGLEPGVVLGPELRAFLEIAAQGFWATLTIGAELTSSEFLSTVSHELRTPLQAVLGWAEVLTQLAPTGDAWRRAVEAIARNARLEAALIDDLLDGSRLARGVLRLRPAPVRMAAAVAIAVGALRPAAGQKQVRLEVEAREPAEVLGDAARLVQVFEHLISNAIKFSPKGGRVGIRIGQSGQRAQVSIEDAGAGIDAEHLPRVFESFWQQEGTETRLHGGLGLGLALVRHIIDLHGGSVTAESPGPGGGATFVVEVPLLGSARVPLERRGRLLEGLRVLIIEDERDVRDGVAVALAGFGADIAVAASGAEALALMDSGPEPDVVISDLRLPDVDGCSLLPKLRSHGSPGSAPALALSALSGPADRERAIEAGFQAHLAKPVAAAELAAAVAALSRRRAGGSLSH